MFRSLFLALVACLLATVTSNKLDKFHVIHADPVDKTKPTPTFEEIRKQITEDRAKEEAHAEEVRADEEVILISPTQEVQICLRNPAESVEEILIRDLLPKDSYIIDFHARNRGQYASTQKETMTEVEAHFFADDGDHEEARSKAILGLIHKDSEVDDIKWYEKEERVDLQDWNGLPYQESAMLVEVAPFDVMCVRIAFKEVVPAEVSAFKDLYKSHITAHVNQRGNGLQGLIESPNYPRSYPNNADINWLIRLPPNRHFGVNIQMQELETESCCDRVYIYDGVTKSAPVIGMLSGNLVNQTAQFTTSGADALVEFRSDCAVNSGYFSFNFSTVTFPLEQACRAREIVEGRDGYITSSNYPVDYPEQAHCDWVIVTPPGTYVRLEVVDFNLDNRDHLKVYDIFSTGPEANADFTGNVDASTYVQGQSNSMELVFDSTNHIVSRRGFVFHYTAVPKPDPCVTGVTLQDQSGLIESPGYPNDYENNQNCTWKVKVADGDVVFIDIEAFATEEYYDYLYIFDGPDENSPVLAALTGTVGQDVDYLSTGNSVFFQFFSDYSVGFSGFHMHYTAYTKTVQCTNQTQLVTSNQGFITTPNYPNPFPSFVACRWIIQTDFTQILTLFLVDVNLGVATKNYFTIYDGNSNNDRVLFNRTDLPSPATLQINATSYQVLMQLTTVDNFEFRGILVRYDTIDLPTQCSSTNVLAAPQGKLQSPLYPGYYPRGYSCSYLIETPALTRVRLAKQAYQLGPGDSLTAYDGDSEKETILFTCTSGSVCSYTEASRNQMFLVFESRSSAPGFSFDFFGSSSTCTLSRHTIDGPSVGYITSPSFPANYPNNQSCEWSLATIPTQVFDIDLKALRTEECCDWVRIYDGPSRASPEIAAWSGTVLPQTITTSGNNAFITFEVNDRVSYDGFDLFYHAYRPKAPIEGSGSGMEKYECYFVDFLNKNASETTGYIMSPGYATNYPNNLDYCWYLRFPQRFRSIELFFSRVEIEEDYDFVMVYPSQTTDVPPVGQVTGIAESVDVVVNNNEATILFHTDESTTSRGFIVQYRAVV